jgi:hypothetical protein
MRERIFIPDEVKSDIAKHMEKAITAAVDGFYSACEDEDSLTGHLGGLLRIGNQNVKVDGRDQISNNWQWSIEYRKFRGRGINATEKILGADGVIELHVAGFRYRVKSLLFQSKLNLRKDIRLLSQCAKLSTWKEAACVINYTEEGYSVYGIEDILRSQGELPSEEKRNSLIDYLNNQFLVCKVGDTSLKYFARERVLQWKSLDGKTVAVDFSVKNRIKINVSPLLGTNFDKNLVDKILSPQELYKHRMEATKEEILQIDSVDSASTSELNKAKKTVSLVYHPDKYSILSELDREILTERIKEMNSAYEEARWRAEGREKGYR